MPDLPGTTPDEDIEMFDKLFSDPDHQWDMLKIYICLDAPYTKIREWKATGRWTPYAEVGNGEQLDRVMRHLLMTIPPYIRINRFNRDIPEQHPSNGYMGYISKNIRGNIYQILTDAMRKEGLYSKDIRSREIRDQPIDDTKLSTVIHSYIGSGDEEHFISLETPSNNNPAEPDRIVGYVRLRLPSSNPDKRHTMQHEKDLPPEIRGAALIRELKVLGIQKVVGGDSDESKICASAPSSNRATPQHRGHGKYLMCMAETRAYRHGYKKVAVISGVGARNYYIDKLGYTQEGSYVTKNLTIWTFLAALVFIFWRWLKIYVRMITCLPEGMSMA